MTVTTRRLGWLLAGAGAALVPWLFVLAATLPPTTTAVHWATAWVGLDSLEAAGLLATGLLLRRAHPLAGLTAAATAALLTADAWLDVTTSTGADHRIAVAMALAAELPLAALCAALAVRTIRRRPPTGNPLAPAPAEAGPGAEAM